MASTSVIYNPCRKFIGDGTIDLDTDTIKMALVTSAYTPNIEHATLAEVSAYELPAEDGYTAGGATVSVLWNRTSATCVLYANAKVSWAQIVATFRYGVLYVAATKDQVTNPLLAYFIFDDAPADVFVSGGFAFKPTNDVLLALNI